MVKLCLHPQSLPIYLTLPLFMADKLYGQEILTFCLFVLDQELLPKTETLSLKFSTNDQQPSLPFHNCSVKYTVTYL